MGICIEVWRQRIGSFIGNHIYKSCSLPSSCLAGFGGSRVRFACIICIFLLMAGIEANPGPPKQNMGDLARRMDDIPAELKNTRTALSVKIDNSVKNLSIKLQLCEQQLVIQTTRLDNADIQRATMLAEIESFKIQVLNLQLSTTPTLPTLAVAVPATSLTQPLTVNDVAHELKLRTSKERNIIIFGISPSTSVSDVHFVTNLLADELNVTTMVTHCLRLGKPNVGRPQLLLATFAHAIDATKVIRLAKSLRNSRNDEVKNNVYINPDLTREQRSIQYNLRTELKHRKAAGEVNLIIKNNCIITKSQSTTNAASAQTTMP